MTKSEQSNHVTIFKDEEDDCIIILAHSIDKDSKYTIEFNSKRELETIWYHPLREFVGFFANFNDRYDNQTGKAYVDVTFRELPKSYCLMAEKKSNPAFQLILTKNDMELAKRVYNQLNAQALEMEKSQSLINR